MTRTINNKICFALMMGLLIMQYADGLRISQAHLGSEKPFSTKQEAYTSLYSRNVLQTPYDILVKNTIDDSPSYIKRSSLTREKPAVLPAWADIDVVMVSKSCDCYQELALEALLKHLNPRKIFLITKDGQCEKLKSSHLPQGKISCLDESNVVPGLSLDEVTKGFHTLERKGICVHAPYDKPPAWFLQQFLKLGFPTANHELSDYFLVWDADMIITDSYDYHDDQGRVVYPADGRGDPSYKQASQTMMSGTNFTNGMVTHHMMMHKPYLAELLDLFEKAKLPQLEKNETSLPLWAQHAMMGACVSKRKRDRGLGFSEYAMYATFVFNYHSANVRMADAETAQKCSRYGGNDILKNQGCMSEEDFNKRAKQLFPGHLIIGHEQHESLR